MKNELCLDLLENSFVLLQTGIPDHLGPDVLLVDGQADIESFVVLVESFHGTQKAVCPRLVSTGYW